MWVVYILRCADGSLYIGHTHDLEKRVTRHNDGCASAHTASRRPVHVVYSEKYLDLTESVRRERQLKRWTRAKKEALIEGDVATVKRL
jgi:predicted GIY-YIG superfamily endonuclease